MGHTGPSSSLTALLLSPVLPHLAAWLAISSSHNPLGVVGWLLYHLVVLMTDWPVYHKGKWLYLHFWICTYKSSLTDAYFSLLACTKIEMWYEKMCKCICVGLCNISNCIHFSSSSIINLPFCICQTFSSFSTLHHHYPCLITLLTVCLFLSSLTHSVVSSWFFFQWWCVYAVSAWYISSRRRAGLLLSLPLGNIHCGPGSLQCFSLWVKAKLNQFSPTLTQIQEQQV